MDGSSAVLVLTSDFNPSSRQICESLVPALRLESMDVFCTDTDGGVDAELFQGLVPTVMQTSHKTLKALRMDLLFAVPLMCYGIHFENVTELEIYVNDATIEGIEPDLLTVVKDFDFTRIFPNLNQIEILNYPARLDFSLGDMSAFVERGNLLVRNGFPDRATKIKHLELKGRIGHLTARFLTEMFPHVRAISVNAEFPFTLLWEHFSCLAELHVKLDEYLLNVPQANWDSPFCGIFPEEVAELRAKDDEFLEAVNIVPVMPSITCMRGLRLFTFKYTPPGIIKGNATYDPARVFSKVTGLIGFRRCPTLSVDLQVSPYGPAVLDHMRPYVTLMT